ncbi:DUF3836 domain-containing protein [Bacteroides ilei]|jgi:hypothetical protein|uniref:DUF3836 domain-containing protein n=1 Tax=Bacteroides ilei TaxID=1907658 RepID=UPI0009305AD7|nr:DUF3836 domain-containing protein [Bacteroides ilei]
MKTINSLKALLVIALVFIANVTVFANRPENNLIYNAEEIDGVKVSETVYKMDGGLLTNYEKYNYKYDDNNQLTENVMQKWDSSENDWQNHMCIKYHYNDSDVTVEYYEWNNKKNDFILLPNRTITMQK